MNTSGKVWEYSDDGTTLIQPLTSVKGLGDSAIDQVFAGRPFNKIEDFLFNEKMTYSKLNKKALDVLVRSHALDCLKDDRFSGSKHFWTAVAVERPRKEKDLTENITKYHPEGDFSTEEKIENLTNLTGVFPMHLVVDESITNELRDLGVPPISDFDPMLGAAWFIPRKVTPRQTKNGKTYWVVQVIDENNVISHIKCWGVRPGKDNIHLNRAYMARLDHSEQWGFSSRSISRFFRMLG